MSATSGRKAVPMRAVASVLTMLVAAPALAQEPVEPDTVPAPPPPPPGFRFGLLGFGGRVGMDLDGDADVVLGYSLDLADVYVDRVRLRPSVEVGLKSGADTYVGSVELLYRFTPDTAIAIPYVGFGIALHGHETCSTDPECPNLWAQFALGFELPFRETFNWMLEYHGEDGLRRHRLFVGLVSRRGL